MSRRFRIVAPSFEIVVSLAVVIILSIPLGPSVIPFGTKGAFNNVDHSLDSIDIAEDLSLSLTRVGAFSKKQNGGLLC